jgi:hypothetical protein
MKITNHYFGKIIFTGVFALIILATNISAATFTVTNTSDSGAGIFFRRKLYITFPPKEKK